MGRKAKTKERQLNPSFRKEYIQTLIPYFLQNGLSRSKTDDIAARLSISKATLYEHFSSRDEIFSLAIELVLEKIREKRTVLYDTTLNFQERYIQLFGLVLQQVIGMTPMLVDDIQKHFPKLWKTIEDYFNEWDEELEKFFRAGQKENEFNEISPAIMSKSITAMLKELISPMFLVKRDISVNRAFIDGFKLHYRGIIPLEKRDDKQVEQILTQVIESALQSAAEIVFAGKLP